MRQWALPKRFHAPHAELLTYRVQVTAQPNKRQVPPGCYLVVRLRASEHDMRIVVGPFDPGEAEHLLVTAEPKDLMELFKRAASETPSPHDTVH